LLQEDTGAQAWDWSWRAGYFRDVTPGHLHLWLKKKERRGLFFPRASGALIDFGRKVSFGKSTFYLR
jgi:hypothetical protein